MLPEGTTRAEAEAVAEKFAAERRLAVLRGEIEEPIDQELRLGKLLAKYHSTPKAQRWSQGHRREQDRCRDFWLREFGPDRLVVSITPDEVERTTADAATVNGWSDRTQQKLQKYLKAASRYGHVKLKKLPEDPLTAVDMADLDTQPSTDGLEYSAEEVALLCTPGPGVDWRVTLAANIAADVGRRIGAIRRLRCEDVSVGERIWLRFRKETDKGRRESTVPVSAETAELILEALKRPEVQAGGWLLPGGHEGSKRRAGVSWGGADATSSAGPIHKLHEAERLLGIDHVRGRGYHGIERAHVTVSWDEASGDAAKVGDLTGNSSPEVLERHYRRKQKASQAAHVDAVRARFKGGAIP